MRVVLDIQLKIVFTDSLIILVQCLQSEISAISQIERRRKRGTPDKGEVIVSGECAASAKTEKKSLVTYSNRLQTPQESYARESLGTPNSFVGEAISQSLGMVSEPPHPSLGARLEKLYSSPIFLFLLALLLPSLTLQSKILRLQLRWCPGSSPGCFNRTDPSPTHSCIAYAKPRNKASSLLHVWT